MENNQKGIESDMQQQKPTQEAMEMGRRFKRARENRQLSLNAAAELSEFVSASYIFRIEKGRTPSLSVIQNLAGVYKVSKETLLGIEPIR
ncbi:helix-turn-helix domain-containing protein [Planococcus donghaensis]|uniref:helix-turn-helix domain-containing protein n=1 Tax=Planococcus donghaensis TaxID=414778 RepID=UPI0037354CAA